MDNEIIIAQSDILRLLNKDNGVTVHFLSEYWNEQHTLEVVTYNPRHKQTFLFYTTKDHNTLEKCYGELVKYVNNLIAVIDGATPNEELRKFVGHSYTVKWADVINQKPVTSHFWADDMDSALCKFHHGKSDKDFTIMSIKLNPEA